MNDLKNSLKNAVDQLFGNSQAPLDDVLLIGLTDSRNNYKNASKGDYKQKKAK